MASQRILAICLVFFATVASIEGQRKDPRVVCYYQSWSVYYHTKYKFTPKDIEPQLCTHLVYAVGALTNETSLAPFDSYQDVDMGGYVDLNGRKRLNPDLKTMLSIGGWNEGSSRFSSIASDENLRKLFTKNAIDFLRQNNFDGLDIDWQFPGSRDGSRVEDKENYVEFVKTLSDEFSKESLSTVRSRLILSITVPVKTDTIDKGFDIPNLNMYVDWMNVVSYNYHTAYESTVNHHAPLYDYNRKGTGIDELNANFTIEYYLAAGADPQKLNLGIPTFGHTYMLSNSDSTDIGSLSDGPGPKGESTDEDGYLAYFEVCQLFLPSSVSDAPKMSGDDEYEDESENWTIVPRGSNASGPYAYKGNQWLCYDDIEIVKRKAEFAAEKSLGGIMFWSVDNDDYLGRCHGEAYPLIKSAKNALYSSFGITEFENITTKSTENIGIQSSSSSSLISASFRESNNKNGDDDSVIIHATNAINATTSDPYTVSVVVVTSPTTTETKILTSSTQPTPLTTEIETSISVLDPIPKVYTPIVFPITPTSTTKPNVVESTPPIQIIPIPTNVQSTVAKSDDETKNGNNIVSNNPNRSAGSIFDTKLSISEFLKYLSNGMVYEKPPQTNDDNFKNVMTKNILIAEPVQYPLVKGDDVNQDNVTGLNGIHIHKVYINNVHLNVYN